MNPQTLRLDLAALIEEAIPDSWEVQTAIRPTFTGPCVQIGHATRIANQSYRYLEADFTITLWVNEGDSDQDIVEFYRLLADADGLRALLIADKRIKKADVLDCGPRDWAAPTWLAGDIEITIQVATPS